MSSAALTAACCQAFLFEHIVCSISQTHVFPTPPRPVLPGARGLLQPLLKRYQARGCPVSVFGLPAVQAIINFKWTTWARRWVLGVGVGFCMATCDRAVSFCCKPVARGRWVRVG